MQTRLKEQFDYLAILRGIWRRHKRLTVLTFLGMALPLLVLLYATSQPLYEASATIVLDTTPVEQLPYFREVRKDNTPTALLVLKSRSLSEAVVETLPKESFEELVRHPLTPDYLQLALNTVRTWMGWPMPPVSPQAKALGELRGRMEFLPTLGGPLSRVITIHGMATSPRVAMDLVNTHVQVLLNRTRGTDQDDAKKMRQFLETQVQQAREQVSQSEVALTRYQQQKGQVRLPAQAELDMTRLSHTEGALAEAQATRQALAARRERLRQALIGPRTAVDRQKAAAVDAQVLEFTQAQDRVTRLEAKLTTLRDRYTEAHPLVQATREEILNEQARVARLAREMPAAPQDGDVPLDRAAIQKQLTKLDAEDADLQTRIQSLKLQTDQLRGRVQTLSTDEVQYGHLARDVEANRNLLAVFSDKLMAARIQSQGDTAAIRIIDAASFPLTATYTRLLRYAMLILGLAGGVAGMLAVGMELWHQPVETEREVERFTGLGVLGTIGRIGRLTAGRGPRDVSLPVHIAAALPRHGIHIDLYRAIRAVVETECLKRPFRTVLVTSAGPAEGKSTTVLNLAHVFQEFGRRVLVVDADLRRPSLHRSLGLPNQPGLLDYLTGTASFEAICRTLPSGVTIIPGQFTREDPASLLASAKIKELLAVARERFDLILVDSAPILAVPDNLLLVSLVERVVLVVQASQTSRRDLQQAQRALEQADARILGVVLNQAHRQDVHYMSPRYRRYYRVPESAAAAARPRAPIARIGGR